MHVRSVRFRVAEHYLTRVFILACHAIALNLSDTFSFKTTVTVSIIQLLGLYMFVIVFEIVLILVTLNADGKCDNKGQSNGLDLARVLCHKTV